MTAESSYQHPIDPLSVFPALITNTESKEAEVSLVASHRDYYLNFYSLSGIMNYDLDVVEKFIAQQIELYAMSAEEIVMGVAVSLQVKKERHAVFYESKGIGIWEKLRPDYEILPLGPTLHMIDAGNA